MHRHLKVFPLSEKDQAKVHLTTTTTIIIFLNIGVTPWSVSWSVSRMNSFSLLLNN